MLTWNSCRVIKLIMLGIETDMSDGFQVGTECLGIGFLRLR